MALQAPQPLLVHGVTAPDVAQVSRRWICAPLAKPLQGGALVALFGLSTARASRARPLRYSVVRQAEISEKPKVAPKAKAKAKAKARRKTPAPLMQQIMEGLFAPIVTIGYFLVGQTFVERIRGKGIELHSRVWPPNDDLHKKSMKQHESQSWRESVKGLCFPALKAITAYCDTFGIQNRKRQGFIKTAKKTGHDLGMLPEGGIFGEGLIGNQAMEWYKDSGISRL
ncbi:unnamed protein product [Durusdinium trenchii]|uniref:Uncharacterized protein n=2 Tax=Durusdinium trenchii TaxID=1381693 RepID=A0ABP0J7D9_9DINO